MSYVNIYTKSNISKTNLINDSQNMLLYTTTTGGTQPPVISKTYKNFYEFELTSGEKKVLILDTTLTETHINEITGDIAGNNKSLLKKAYISNNCIEIDSNTFKNCSGLTYVNYINLVDVSLSTIGSSAFENCANLDECKLFDISNLITNISNRAFYGCSKLFEAQIHNSSLLQTLGDSAFELCTILNTVIFEGTIVSIGDECFKNSGLVNITFSGSLPTTLDGSYIFQGIPENATVYYNSNYISAGNYTTLKNLFPNSGAEVIFVDVINNIIENSKTFYTITNDSVLNADVAQTKTILDSLILRRNGSTMYSINITLDYSLHGTNTLGRAYWTNRVIELNPDNSGIMCELNNITYSMNVVVLIHEILHIFGFGSSTIWNNYKFQDYFYSGPNGVYQYNKLLYNNGFIKKRDYFAIEDSGGGGTAGAHIEEGYRVESNILVYQIRYGPNGLLPSFQYEIMTGWLNSSNYISRQCLGVLQDLEFSVNYKSPHFYNGAMSFLPNIT